jgi:hypothetical protein
MEDWGDVESVARNDWRSRWNVDGRNSDLQSSTKRSLN